MDKIESLNKCNQCSVTFIAASTLKIHMKQIHPDTDSKNCKFCEKTYNRKEHLEEHIKAIHEGKRWKCNEDQCEKSYESQRALDHHKRRVHLGTKGLDHYQCDICGKTSSSGTDMKVHRLSVHLGKT